MSAPLPITCNLINNEFRYFYQKYFIKLILIENLDNIIIVCYDIKELDLKRYEIKLNINDFKSYRIFKIFEKVDEIYELLFQTLESKRFNIK